MSPTQSGPCKVCNKATPDGIGSEWICVPCQHGYVMPMRVIDMEAELARLRAEVATLTRERDEARAMLRAHPETCACDECYGVKP